MAERSMAKIFRIEDMSDKEFSDERHKVRFRHWKNSILTLPANHTHFGFSIAGSLAIDTPTLTARLPSGGFFRIQGEGTIEGTDGFAISMPGKKGFTQISGPYANVELIEYLPGGRQNCLIWPAAINLPSLNTLYLSSDKIQESHSHDSMRINVVISGSATCITNEETLKISEGDVIVIHANENHRFQTQSHSLKFVAFHPDSHRLIFSAEQNPMILKTFGLPPR